LGSFLGGARPPSFSRGLHPIVFDEKWAGAGPFQLDAVVPTWQPELPKAVVIPRMDLLKLSYDQIRQLRQDCADDAVDIPKRGSSIPQR
jgi:hypothetical protein